ncbi:zinc-dependent metalloprotease [Hoyosella sp. G463]|uniref:Zinc-dependent metalloprotease n=1 Tax=Lolliginicoccus lacisalsi TaxID=2742202 RepID=A0A927JDT5_9ACTN|nr:zinc-dependent metalloprotease [Lolliginicoccus lacisalsi]
MDSPSEPGPRAPGKGDESRSSAAVDWTLAVRVAARLARAEPSMSSYTREQVRSELVELAASAEEPVREVTRLKDGAQVPEALILDRPGWSRAAASSLAGLLGGSIEQRPRGLLAGRASGLQAGAVLGILSNAIIGQYDPFAGQGGQLLLVAPNIIHTERATRVRPRDFRTWVCLHEVTHRVQFSASPWLGGHMRALIDTATPASGEPLLAAGQRLVTAIRSRDGSRDADPLLGTGILGIVLESQPPEQRDAMIGLIMLGTLLEGHAEHVMDAAGPRVVPTVEHIRAVFDERRHERRGLLQWIMRTLLGMDAKMAQYAQGKRFVDTLVERVGMDSFNTIWTSPETLPRPSEIREPEKWITRVLE